MRNTEQSSHDYINCSATFCRCGKDNDRMIQFSTGTSAPSTMLSSETVTRSTEDKWIWQRLKSARLDHFTVGIYIDLYWNHRHLNRYMYRYMKKSVASDICWIVYFPQENRHYITMYKSLFFLLSQQLRIHLRWSYE